MSIVARIAASLACTVFGVVFWTTLTTISTTVSRGYPREWDWYGRTAVYLFCALPGWLIALPFVTYFKDLAGIRPWIMLAVGSAIGPSFMATWTAVEGDRFTWKSDGSAVMLAFWIGFITTASYVVWLLLVERSGRSREVELQQPTSVA